MNVYRLEQMMKKYNIKNNIIKIIKINFYKNKNNNMKIIKNKLIKK
jgi:hypothetical protein